jgi:membrane protease YdiL (CAAX protease family)
MTETPNWGGNESLPAPPAPGLRARFFRGDSWLAAFGRTGMYLVFAAALAVILGFAARPLMRSKLTPSHYLLLLGTETILTIAVIGAALPMSFLEKRQPGEYGIPVHLAFGKLFWQGVLAGLVEVTALIGIIAALGGYSFGSFAVHGPLMVRWLLLWAVFFVVVGFGEEFLFRGYAQYTLGRGLGFWPAAILLSIVFGLLHLANPGEGWVGAVSVVFFGLAMCFSLRRTGSLWFAVGLHASFDFGESFLYSVPNSGVVLDGHLSNAAMHGPAWLTGGSIGPEGSIFCFLMTGLLCYLIHRLYPARDGAAQPS